MRSFQLYPIVKFSFEHKNIYLSECFFWHAKFFYVRWTKSSFYWNHRLWWLVLGVFILSLQSFKIFRLHAIVHIAAGAVRAHGGKSSGNCYMIGRGPNSCLLVHVTGLLFCFYVILFLLFLFQSYRLWISVSCIVQNIELTGINLP